MRPNNSGNGRGHGLLGPGPSLKARYLDRELETLRRKRELIQLKHQMLSYKCEMESKRQYEQTNRNVPNMYGNVWQPSPPKRAYIPQQVKPWRDTPQDPFVLNMSKPMPSNYIPSLLDKQFEMPHQPLISSAPILKPIVHPILLDSIGNRTFKPPFRVQKDYRAPHKVMKKQPQGPPNKLNSYPEKDRKGLVFLALGKPESAVNKGFKVPENPKAMILHEDQKPSLQITGRLELALGNIVKEIRADNRDNDEFQQFVSKPIHQRVMKQVIRERIRSIMLNKTVDSVIHIVDRYRAKFPKKGDKDLVELVINNGRHKPEVVETENPEEIFKKNIDLILKKKLKEMSSNLLKMYTDGNDKTILSKKKANNSLNEPIEEEVAMTTLRNLTRKYVTIEDKNVLTKYYTQLIEDILEKKLPEYLPECTEYFWKILNLDHEFMDKVTKGPAKKHNKTGNIALDTNNTMGEGAFENDEMDEKAEIEPNASEEKKYDEIDEAETEPNASEEKKVDENNVMVEEAVTENSQTSGKNDTQLGTLIKNMPVEEITSDDQNPVLNETDKCEEITPAVAVQIEAEQSLTPNPALPVSNKAQVSSMNIEQVTSVSNKEKISAATKPTSPMLKEAELPSNPLKTPVNPATPSAKELPYYVKLIGRPTLPTRPVICDFLNNYHPTSIKKHKSINNLLVVGFNNQDDYNSIQTANETVIGDITIIIKGSEKVNLVKENDSTKQDSHSKKENKKEINDISAQKDTEDGNKTGKETKDGDKTGKETKDGMSDQKEKTDNNNSQYEDEKDFIGKELNDQITNLLSTIKETDEEVTEIPKDNSSIKAPLKTNDDLSQESTEPLNGVLATIKEDEIEVINGDKTNSDKVKGSKGNVNQTATPVRSSSRLANVTPSTIRTRRASRLMQEQSLE